jgi:hypothetical protein
VRSSRNPLSYCRLLIFRAGRADFLTARVRKARNLRQREFSQA